MEPALPISLPSRSHRRPSGGAGALAACVLAAGLAAPLGAAPPSVGVAVHHDVLPRLAAVRSEPALRSSGERLEELDQSIPSGLGGAAPLDKGGVLAGVQAPPPRLVLESLTDTANPADSTGDAGPHHYFQIANGGFTIWDKQGNRLLLSEYLYALWQGFGGLCEQFAGDPYVLYDGQADRWLVAAMSFGNVETGPWLECVALSQTGDPLGGWHRWAWSFDRLNDFPKLGVWPDAYVMTINGIPPPHAVIAFERDKMLAGDPAPRKIQFDLDQEQWGVHSLLVPADLEGSRPPPTGAPNPVLGVKQATPGGPGDTLEILDLHVDWSDPAASSLTRTATFPLSPQGVFRRGPYHRVAYRNFGGFEALVTTTIVVAADELDMEWYHYRRRTGGGWALWQQGIFNPDDGWESCPTAAMDGAGNLAAVWQKTSKVSVPPFERVPSVQYSGRQPADPPGLLRAPRTLVDSQTVDAGGRFGDYTSIVVDPADDCTFWLTGQYVTQGPLFPLTNIRIATFAFPNCPDRQAPDTRIQSAPPAASGADVQFVFDSTEPGSMFDCALDAAPFAPCASPLSLSGLGTAQHSFRVRALDSAGNVDATPALWTWQVGDGDPPPPSATWQSSPALPGFELQVQVTAGNRVVPTRQETDCLPETVCFSGAVPGRSELMVRVVGPKPNGYLWPNLVKFSTSQIELWIRRTGAAPVRYYRLPAPPEGSAALNGLVDRLGFSATAPEKEPLADREPPASLVFPPSRTAAADPLPPSSTWMTTPAIPGFRFQVRVDGGGTTTRREADCIPETLCVSAAKRGRSELFVRIVGPKSNGYLWPHLVKFSTSRIEVWIEQTAGGARRYYDLPADAAESGTLTGLFDRLGFHP